MNQTRRSVLKAGAGALAFGGLAGCLSEPEGEAGDRTGYASFFALWDWAEHVGGDEFSFENPVTTGEMGHGWEPDGDLAAEIATTDAFIYLDTPEFSWAQDIAAQLETDYDDVAVIDGMDGLGGHLLPIDRDVAAEPDYDYDFDPDTLEIGEFDVLDGRTGEMTAYWHNDHWHESLPDIPVGESVPIEGVFADTEGRVLPLGEDEQFQFDARLDEGAPEDVVEIESHGDHVELHGLEANRTLLVFELRHDGEVLWDTADEGIATDVVEELDDEEADEFVDPHVWVDPVLAQRVVDTIATGLGEVDPDNAELYEENATAYNERLEAVDRQFEELLENASRDVAVFAGHDSYQYVEQRYGFELYTPVGISPDAAESFEDISGMVDLVEEYDVDTVLYDPFESPDPDEQFPSMVELLIEDSQVTDAEPLSPAEGTTHEWDEQDWGWVEQMEEVNLPSLRKALDAS